jgi:hypothetical protein
VADSCEQDSGSLGIIKCRDFTSVAEEPLASSKTLVQAVRY